MLEAQGISGKPLLPQKWFRSPWLLLPVDGPSNEYVSETSQTLLVKLFLKEVRQLGSEKQMDETGRRKLRDLTVQFVTGLEAATPKLALKPASVQALKDLFLERHSSWAYEISGAGPPIFAGASWSFIRAEAARAEAQEAEEQKAVLEAQSQELQATLAGYAGEDRPEDELADPVDEAEAKTRLETLKKVHGLSLQKFWADMLGAQI